MPPHLPNTQNSLSEPKPYSRDARNEDDYDSHSLQVQQERAWLREQLLAGKNSPLCGTRRRGNSSILRTNVFRALVDFAPGHH
jgi:hypothetical protein